MGAVPEESLSYAVQIENVTKKFAGLTAVKNVSLNISPGEKHSIIGPNGAGKTTLFNMISGELLPSSGKIYLMGKDVTKMHTHKRVPIGLARTFQVTNLFPEMSIMENVILGLQGVKKSRFVMWRFLKSYSELYKEAERLLREFNLWHLRDELVMYLSYGDQRLLEVVLGLTSGPKILALDEPTAGLSSAETSKLVEVLKNLDKDLSIILIEHDMKVAYEVTQNMTVLSDGEVIAAGRVEDVRNNARVKECYLGTVKNNNDS